MSVTLMQLCQAFISNRKNYNITTLNLSATVVFAYYFGRYHEFNIPFMMMDFSYSNYFFIFSFFMIVVLESLVFKVFTKDRKETEEKTKDLETFLIVLTNLTMGILIVFATIDLVKNASFTIGTTVCVLAYMICLYFYFKSGNNSKSNNYFCMSLIGVIIFAFFVDS